MNGGMQCITTPRTAYERCQCKTGEKYVSIIEYSHKYFSFHNIYFRTNLFYRIHVNPIILFCRPKIYLLKKAICYPYQKASFKISKHLKYIFKKKQYVIHTKRNLLKYQGFLPKRLIFQVTEVRFLIFNT